MNRFNNPILVFDIETIPDIETGRKVYDELANLNDDDALTALIAIRQAEANTEFMRLPLHKIACLSFFWADLKTQQFSLKSLSLETHSENEILGIFMRAFDKTPMPILVSWNGGGFDIPVLLYRTLHHKLSAPKLFGDNGKNSYTSRYSTMHLDLMDKLSLHNYSYKQKLDTIAALCGFCGKGDIDGSQVLPMVQAGEWEKLTTYCESDVLNTWFIYLRYQVLMGQLTTYEYELIASDTTTYLQTLINSTGQYRHADFIKGCQP